MNDTEIEKVVLEKGLTAPRITTEQIDLLVSHIHYAIYQPPGTTSTFVHAYLDGKFFLATGDSACVSLENFNAELGYRMARDNAMALARTKLWELEGYRLYQQLRTS